MARYPTVDEYRQKPQKGIQRCDELLKKNPNDVQLLATKLQLTKLSGKSDGDNLIEHLLTIQPPVRDVADIISIEDVVVAPLLETFPQPLTAGPQMSKLWENAVKAQPSLNHKLDLISVRFARAVTDNRMQDAQQALIQLKPLTPKNRVVYMAHAIVTQLISTSKEDLQARLALSLARKAVSDKFDDDERLDCRVPGQIFALQESESDLDAIKDRKFKESKQVYQALRRLGRTAVNGDASSITPPEARDTTDDKKLVSESNALGETFKLHVVDSNDLTKVEELANDAVRLFVKATTRLKLQRPRLSSEPCFIAISALVKLFVITKSPTYLMQAAWLAESLLTYYDHIHEAKLILVYLYMWLGLGSLALQRFDSLSIKEIQFDTVGHTLFPGIAITHPHKIVVRHSGDVDPFQTTKKALAVYARCETKLADTEADVLSHGQTGMILDLHELRGALRDSLTRRMLLLEQRRLARLGLTSLKATSDFHAMPLTYWTAFKDNRDFDATFDFGLNVERALYTRLDPKISLLYTLAADTAWSICVNMPKVLRDEDALLAELENLSNDTTTSIETDKITDTAMIELLSGRVAHQVLRLIKGVGGTSSDLDAIVKSTNEALDSFDMESLTGGDQPGITRHLSAHFAFVESLRLVKIASGFLSKKSGLDNDGVGKLAERCRRDFARLQQDCKKRPSITGQHVGGYLARGEGTWKELRQLKPGPFCDMVAGSADQGWASFSKLRLDL